MRLSNVVPVEIVWRTSGDPPKNTSKYPVGGLGLVSGQLLPEQH